MRIEVDFVVRIVVVRFVAVASGSGAFRDDAAGSERQERGHDGNGGYLSSFHDGVLLAVGLCYLRHRGEGEPTDRPLCRSPTIYSSKFPAMYFAGNSMHFTHSVEDISRRCKFTFRRPFIFANYQNGENPVCESSMTAEPRL
jgi:hypothetical protein